MWIMSVDILCAETHQVQVSRCADDALFGEINLMPGTESKFAQNGKTYTGDYLMKVGLDVFTCNHNTSMVVEIVAE